MVYKQSSEFDNSLNFYTKLDEILERVDKSIENYYCERKPVSDIRQLEKIRQELLIMKTKSSQEFNPSFPRMIVDSWDFSNTLGAELLELNELYNKNDK